jgi:outer membrane protein TolC
MIRCMVVFLLTLFPALAQNPVLRLDMKRAVEIALAPDGNSRVQLAKEQIRQAQSRSAEARAALLPDFEGYVSDQSETANLGAFGISFKLPIPGFQIPRFVGPFDVFDARATVNANVFDFSAIRSFQAARTEIRTAKAERNNADDQVAGLAARAYLAALRAEADLETAKANVTLAEAVLALANHQKNAGTGTGIEVTRAQVELANQRQRLLVAENARTQSHLQLLRAMNLDLDTAVELSEALAYIPVDPLTVASATAEAIKNRADLRAQQSHEESARLSYSAAKMERLPSVVGFANYGSIGTGLDNALPTRIYGLSLRVPVFDGGRRDAQRAESMSLVRQEGIRTRDLEQQVKLDVRLAADALRSADAQVKVAAEGLTLAENELAQAKRRYEAGVANGLEVTDAQTRLEQARDNRVAALFNYNQARLDLGQAMGTIRSMVQ